MTSAPARPVRVITDPAEVATWISARKEFASVERELVNMIADSGALLSGFFHLLSGQHSTMFLRYSTVASLLENNRRVAELLAKQIEDSGVHFERILSPDTAGMNLAYELARLLHVQRLVAKTNARRQPDAILNGIALEPDQRVLLVNDLITSGSGMANMRALVESVHHGVVVGRTVFALRQSTPSPRDPAPTNEPMFALVDLNVETATYGTPVSLDFSQCEVCRETEGAIYSGDIN